MVSSQHPSSRDVESALCRGHSPAQAPQGLQDVPHVGSALSLEGFRLQNSSRPALRTNFKFSHMNNFS